MKRQLGEMSFVIFQKFGIQIGLRSSQIGYVKAASPAFCFAAPTVWNNLSEHVKSSA